MTGIRYIADAKRTITVGSPIPSRRGGGILVPEGGGQPEFGDLTRLPYGVIYSPTDTLFRALDYEGNVLDSYTYPYTMDSCSIAVTKNGEIVIGSGNNGIIRLSYDFNTEVLSEVFRRQFSGVLHDAQWFGPSEEVFFTGRGGGSGTANLLKYNALASELLGSWDAFLDGSFLNCFGVWISGKSNYLWTLVLDGQIVYVAKFDFDLNLQSWNNFGNFGDANAPYSILSLPDTDDFIIGLPGSVRRYTSAYSLVWQISDSASGVGALDYDATGIYISSNSFNRKVSFDGNVIWSEVGAQGDHSVKTDGFSRVVFCNSFGGIGTETSRFRVLDLDGNFQSTFDLAGTTVGIGVDPGPQIYL